MLRQLPPSCVMTEALLIPLVVEKHLEIVEKSAAACGLVVFQKKCPANTLEASWAFPEVLAGQAGLL